MTFDEPGGFREAQTRVDSYAQDRNKARKLIERAITKAYRHKDQLQTMWDSLMSLCRMVRAWSRGEYKALPWKTIVMALAAVFYFLDPLDVVPDFIPGVGYIDDAVVLGFVIRSIQTDLAKFLDWETSR